MPLSCKSCATRSRGKAGVRLFGLSPLDDQHLAGAVMWASGDSITALALGVLASAARARQRPAKV